MDGNTRGMGLGKPPGFWFYWIAFVNDLLKLANMQNIRDCKCQKQLILQEPITYMFVETVSIYADIKKTAKTGR